MKNIYVLIGAAIVLLCGCAGQSSQIANVTMKSQQPWLCQGVSGEWQCNRGTSKPSKPTDAIEQIVNKRTLKPKTLSTPDMPLSSLGKPVVRDIAPKAATTPTAPEVKVIKATGAATVENAWTIQWAALSTSAAAQRYGIKYLADSGTDYEIRPIRVKNRNYYILFSGRYPSRADAAEAAKQIRTAKSAAPFFRTISSIKAASIQ